jgi:hypothetical protein
MHKFAATWRIRKLLFAGSDLIKTDSAIVAIGGQKWPSEVIRGHQWSSEVMRGIRGYQWSSEVISGLP